VNQAMPTERTLTVLQNVDALYWKAANDQAQAVSLGANTVCIFNSSPLEKYESYRLCLEKWHSDDTPDFTPAIYNMILSLARTLGFRTDSPRNGTQPKQLADSLPEVVPTDNEHFLASLSDKDRAAVEERGCVYSPQSNTFYIRDLKMAEAAAECARFLHYVCKGMSREYAPSTLEDTLAYFGARLLCPGSLNEDIPAHKSGATLYEGYIAGRVSRADLRRMFLTGTKS
jgi:hypothetical protein